MTENQGPNTPPFGGPQPYGRPAGPDYAAEHPVPGFSAQDFPAPDGVPRLAPAALAAPSVPVRPARARLGTVIAASALSAVLGVGAGLGGYAYLNPGGAGATSPITVTGVPANADPKVDGSVTAAAQKIQPSVVTIAVQAGNSGGIGTGVVLDTNGYILTNDHVVSPAGQGGTLTVTFQNGKTARATVVGTSASNDLAVIKVDGVSDLTPATFAQSESLTVGQTVVAVGAPLGLSESVTSGIVSSTARPVRSGDNGDAVYMAVQTDAAINPGNSGGPLVDLNGSVIGINSSIASTGSGQGGQSGNIGIGFAIPSDVAVRVAGELIASGKAPNAALGVSLAGSDSDFSPATGVTLESVTGGGAAARAGLRAGDVVTKLNDFYTTTADALIAATRFYAPGTEVTVTYTRDGQDRTAQVTLGSM